MLDRSNKQNRSFNLELKNQVQFPHGVNATTPSADPMSTGSAKSHALTENVQIYFGRITDHVAYTRAYRVQIEGGPAIVCCDLVQSSLTPIGAKQINTYVPGSGVYVLWHPKSTYGIIIGAVPDYLTDSRLSMSDFVNQGSRVGFNVDLVNKFPLYLSNSGNISNWSANRPFDSSGVGEWGAFTETGLAVFLDPFMAYMRVDESTGLFLFYHDQLARLSGYNLQIRTSGNEREDLDDQNEICHFEGQATYPWEARGRFFLTPNSYRELDSETQQKQYQFYSRFEPIEDEQQPFYRLMTYRGYLGQIESRYVSLVPDLGPYRLDLAHVYPGVFEEHIALNGRYTLRSVKGITIGKTNYICVPKQIRRQEDPEGDNPTHYKFSGLGNFGKNHVIYDSLPFTPVYPDPAAEHEGAVRAAAILDQLAYQFNWEALHPFHYHTQDWYVPEEQNLPTFDENSNSLDFFSMQSKQYMTMPTPKNYYIDHRYGIGKFYLTESFLNFAEDGGITLADGYGFELRSTQGNVFISAPGDIWFLPGKNLNIWSGFDTIVKAKNSIDLSASNKDVRIKADRNMQFLSGLSGCGGTIIENRGVDNVSDFNDKIGEDVLFTGILLKSRDSHVSSLGKHILLSTNVKKYGSDNIFKSENPTLSGPEEFIGGPIVIDAGPGEKGSILTYSRIFHRRIGKAAFDCFEVNPGAPVKDAYSVNAYWAGRAHFGGIVQSEKSGYFKENLVVGNSIFAKNKIANQSGKINKITDAQKIEDIITMIDDTAFDLKNEADNYKNSGRELIEDTGGGLRLAEFSFRNELQYKTVDFMIYELRWHQLARMNFTYLSLPKWTEKTSEQLVNDTYNKVKYTAPHPGYRKWFVENCYGFQNLSLYTPSGQRAIRNQYGSYTDYEYARILSPNTLLLNDMYATIL